MTKHQNRTIPMNEDLAKLAYQFANLIDDKEIDKQWHDLDNREWWLDFAEVAIPLISAEARKQEGAEVLGIIADAAYSHSSSLDLILPFETWQEINKPIFEQALKGDKEAE